MRRWMLTVLCLPLAAAIGSGCADPAANIDPRADAALQRMSKTLAEAKSFKVHVKATIEDRLQTGQLAQFSRDSLVTVDRPDRICASVRRGPDSYKIWHEGKDLTILDVAEDQYACAETPKAIGEMLDYMAEEHGLVVPCADLLYPNPYAVLTEKVTAGEFVDQQEIDGRLCDHLHFTQNNVDWQIWIDTGSQAVPRRLVITYKQDPDHPQYESTMDQWELNVPTKSSDFKPVLPASAKKVEMADLEDQD